MSRPSQTTARPRILEMTEASTPLSELPPKAQLILAAAQRIVVRDGFSRLSFASVAQEADVYQSAVRYYFGSKAGLVQALVDASTHDVSAEVRTSVPAVGQLQERLRAVITASRTVPAAEEYRSMWELLPHILRDDTLREGVSQLYEAYRSHGEELFNDRDDEEYRDTVRAYACLMLAVIEGVAIQRALDPAAVNVDRVFGLWADIVCRSVDEILAEQSGPPTTDG